MPHALARVLKHLLVTHCTYTRRPYCLINLGIIFQMARSGTELSIQLLGGARRLTPANSHQLPLAVILAGPGKSGTYGLAIARHLATQVSLSFLYFRYLCLSHGAL